MVEDTVARDGARWWFSAVLLPALRGLVTVGALAVAYLLAYELRFEFRVPDDFRTTSLVTLPFVVVLKVVVMRVLGVQRQSWQFTSLRDAVALTAAMSAAATILVVVRFAFPDLSAVFGQNLPAPLPLGVIAADLALSVLALGGVRAVRRLQAEQSESRRLREDGTGRTQRVLIVGAGRAGGLVAREIAARPDLGLIPVGFLDDDVSKQRQRIHGLNVLARSDDLVEVVDKHQVDQVIIAMPEVGGPVIRRLLESCRQAQVQARIVPGVYEILDGRVSLQRLRPVRIEDLLRRDTVELDTSSIGEVVNDASIVVTGAGGSIGSELCRQLLRFGPRELVLLDQAEGPLWAIHRELVAADTLVELVPAIADVCDQARIEQLFARHRPSLVFHAAAHKHVPMMEVNVGEAVKNNVFGTRTVVDAAVAAGVERFVLVSTDKAVNPSSVMGATKRIAERYVQDIAVGTGLPYVSVRFGNVLGSAGSVIPIFEEQIAAGGPVTVTHPEMRRYFMTIPEASALVVQAGAVGQPGDVLVLDMGEPVRIDELARDLIRLSGLRPDEDIAIEYTGVRPGEKLFEELSLDSEEVDATSHPSIFVARAASHQRPEDELELEDLATAACSGTSAAVRTALIRLVPALTDHVPTPGA